MCMNVSSTSPVVDDIFNMHTQAPTHSISQTNKTIHLNHLFLHCRLHWIVTLIDTYDRFTAKNCSSFRRQWCWMPSKNVCMQISITLTHSVCLSVTRNQLKIACWECHSFEWNCLVWKIQLKCNERINSIRMSFNKSNQWNKDNVWLVCMICGLMLAVV